ncbi:MAG: penicillin acylase family protein [Gemmatimonadetes bacterium]|nr:penicillin acylase family protein [Gemmatimonadota bacterium]
MPRLSLFVLALVAAACSTGGPSREERSRWEAQAARVTITRDDWGIPHIRGKSDADAVFGMVSAQAEDDFNRIEVNYLNAMGRLAEAEGKKAIWSDLRMRLFIDPDTLRAQYAASPAWLRTLMDAWADGLNHFLATHPEVKPRVLTHFEPWMALAFSEGSIGGDIETISLPALEAFYGGPDTASASAGSAHLDVARAAAPTFLVEPTGSNGFAIGPSRSASGKALLLINPHTSFFFREELQMTSDEGLNAYGAVTWGQFFVYQGFNATAGWMHTSSNNDAIDEYAVTATRTADGYTYAYDSAQRRVVSQRISLRYRDGDRMATREFTVYRTHHGPVVREAEGKWIAVRLMNEPVKALTQSFSRTKAKNLAEFRATMELHTNSSNNTVFADAEGNTAYFHANFIPRRDTRYDWSKPVDGSDPRTEWQGVHSVDESPNVFNPSTGWIQNTNNAPFSAAGAASPKPSAYPRYFEAGEGENARGLHAIEVLSRERAFDLDKLIAAAYDPHLPAFDALIPALVRDYDALRASDARKAALKEPVALLRAWDRRSGTKSVALTLAHYWGTELVTRVRTDPDAEGTSVFAYMARAASGEHRLGALEAAVARLTADFGDWRTAWGDVNRFQRLTADIEQPFSDSGASIPVGFASANWGSLAAFGARQYPGTKRMYGTYGNSFVAVVEFGDSVMARAITAGGLNSVPGSKHFNDQAERYARGDLRTVYFHPSQLEGHVERVYRPGERP